MNKGETLTLASATFGDIGILDTHSTVVIWGDGVHETEAVNQSAGTLSGSHVYNAERVSTQRLSLWMTTADLSQVRSRRRLPQETL